MKTIPPEADIVRAVQQHLPGVLEARILVSSPQKSVCCASGSRSDTSGGYEIRRKDWKSIRSVTAPLKKRDWDAKAVYLVRVGLYFTSSFPSINPHIKRGTNGVSVSQEKLPTRIRSVPAVYRFVLSLLNGRKDCPFDAIQDVTLAPPLDGETESKRAFKGFAFVTLSSTDLVKQLLEDWSWSPGDQSTPASGRIPASVSADVTDARKYGVRVITKARWEELRDEYLAYRAQLLNSFHEEDRGFGASVQQKSGMAEPGGPSHFALPQDYPRGCLVFTKNIHTETNKTTLRTLFSSAVGFPREVLDYVDFNKGMDSVSSKCDSGTLADSWARCRSVSYVSEATKKRPLSSSISTPICSRNRVA